MTEGDKYCLVKKVEKLEGFDASFHPFCVQFNMNSKMPLSINFDTLKTSNYHFAFISFAIYDTLTAKGVLTIDKLCDSLFTIKGKLTFKPRGYTLKFDDTTKLYN